MSLIWEAHNVIDRWREWSEHQHLSHDEFCALISDSDELQDRLLDAELARQRAADSATPRETES